MYSKLKSGDLLYRNNGIIQHVGVYLGNGQVLHNTPNEGVVMLSIEHFAEGHRIKITHTCEANTKLLTQRLLEITASDERYHLLVKNCEHVANFIISGRRMSPQIRATFIGAGMGCLVGYQSKNSNLLTCAAFGGLIGLLVCNLTKEFDCYMHPVDYTKLVSTWC